MLFQLLVCVSLLIIGVSLFMIARYIRKHP